MKLEKIEKLCAEATPGPWEADKQYCRVQLKNDPYGLIAWADDGGFCRGEDVFFIAAARTLMPKLLAVAKAAKTVDSHFETMEKTSSGYNTYFLDPSIFRKEIKRALEELEKE